MFGLSSPSQQSTFDPSCYGDRPTYGVLNYLRLRLPFPDDSNASTPVQAAVLNSVVRPRVVLSTGQQLSAFPTGVTTGPVRTDSRSYGTLNHINHTLWDFFNAIPSVNLATALVEFIMSQSPTPPPNSSLLVQQIDSLPIVEIAALGLVQPNDITGVLSSFSTPSDKLFFGTDQSLALRAWAINGTSSSVSWADSATAPQRVLDSSFDNPIFNNVWKPAVAYLHNLSTAQAVNSGEVVSSLQSIGLFSS